MDETEGSRINTGGDEQVAAGFTIGSASGRYSYEGRGVTTAALRIPRVVGHGLGQQTQQQQQTDKVEKEKSYCSSSSSAPHFGGSFNPNCVSSPVAIQHSGTFAPTTSPTPLAPSVAVSPLQNTPTKSTLSSLVVYCNTNKKGEPSTPSLPQADFHNNKNNNSVGSNREDTDISLRIKANRAATGLLLAANSLQLQPDATCSLSLSPSPPPSTSLAAPCHSTSSPIIDATAHQRHKKPQTLNLNGARAQPRQETISEKVSQLTAALRSNSSNIHTQLRNERRVILDNCQSVGSSPTRSLSRINNCHVQTANNITAASTTIQRSGTTEIFTVNAQTKQRHKVSPSDRNQNQYENYQCNLTVSPTSPNLLLTPSGMHARARNSGGQWAPTPPQRTLTRDGATNSLHISDISPQPPQLQQQPHFDDHSTDLTQSSGYFSIKMDSPAGETDTSNSSQAKYEEQTSLSFWAQPHSHHKVNTG